MKSWVNLGLIDRLYYITPTQPVILFFPCPQLPFHRHIHSRLTSFLTHCLCISLNFNRQSHSSSTTIRHGRELERLYPEGNRPTVGVHASQTGSTDRAKPTDSWWFSACGTLASTEWRRLHWGSAGKNSPFLVDHARANISFPTGCPHAISRSSCDHRAGIFCLSMLPLHNIG